MYELVKKKNTAVRIITGIAIFFVITQILKLLLQEPKVTISGELVKLANEVNKHAPYVVDSITTFDNLNPIGASVLQYNYTLKIDKSTIDSAELAKEIKKGFLSLLKKNPKAGFFKENEIEIRANYADSTGAALSQISVLPNEY